jgi:eukaryotic-like serine/threonine-protein kinase
MVKNQARPLHSVRPATQPPASGLVAAEPALPVRAGEMVNGKYLVEALIGEGGVGIVVAAQNVELGERVALKFLRPESATNPEVVARFVREAKAASALRCEYVASVFDVGSLPSGAPFIVMELLEGKNLGELIQDRGPLSVREVAEYTMQTCEALATAHARGVVHRDIKPENLFLAQRGGVEVIKVLDFGISKASLTGNIFGSPVPLVRTVNLMGTPLYMSPEQVRCSDGVDARSDIWALGMVMYELLSGTSAFVASSITELCAAILESTAQPVDKLRADVPPGLAAIIQRCMEKDPAKRYQDVAELCQALMPFAPKRARLNAERATRVLVAAGIVEESSLEALSSIPPSSSSTLPGSLPISLSAPRVPVIASGEYPVSGAPAPLESAPSVTAETQMVDLPEPARGGRAKLVVGVALAALAAGLVAVLATKTSAEPSTAVATPTVEAAPVAPPAAPKAAEPAVAEPAKAAATPAKAAVAPAKAAEPAAAAVAAPKAPAWSAKRAVWVAPAPAPKPAPPAATPKRAKNSSGEPDLGY